MNFDILGTIRKGLGNIECYEFDTDVNGAALAMALHFSKTQSNINSIAYVTVGTGVGVGILANNQLVHGMLHPEAGHVLYVLNCLNIVCAFLKFISFFFSFPRAEGDHKEQFKGTCPFHGDCLEGLVASGSLSARKNIPAKELASLSDDDELWDIVSFYLAHLSVMLVSTVSSQIVVIGGGIMQRTILFEKIRSYATKFVNGYLDVDFTRVILESPFGQDAGIIGAAALAQNAFNGK